MFVETVQSNLFIYLFIFPHVINLVLFALLMPVLLFFWITEARAKIVVSGLFPV